MSIGPLRPAALLVLVATAVVGCANPFARPAERTEHPSAQGSVATPTANPAPSSAVPAADPVIVAVGDIAQCRSTGDEATAALVAQHPSATVVTMGDNAYRNGTRMEFANCYHPSWGAFKGRTRPSPGNHEYRTRGAAGYFAYFGAAAGEAGKGYYSYDLGTWHLIALNSNCTIVSCAAGSAQERWLRADLAAHRSSCTLAYFHHPRFSSGEHGDDRDVDALWRALYDARVDVVLNGHDHNYERFAPQNPDGEPDPRGIRQFVVGTGGGELRSVERVAGNSEVRASHLYGVLRMELRRGAYTWRFLPAAGSSFTDAGTGNCV